MIHLQLVFIEIEHHEKRVAFESSVPSFPDFTERCSCRPEALETEGIYSGNSLKRLPCVNTVTQKGQNMTAGRSGLTMKNVLFLSMSYDAVWLMDPSRNIPFGKIH